MIYLFKPGGVTITNLTLIILIEHYPKKGIGTIQMSDPKQWAFFLGGPSKASRSISIEAWKNVSIFNMIQLHGIVSNVYIISSKLILDDLRCFKMSFSPWFTSILPAIRFSFRIAMRPRRTAWSVPSAEPSSGSETRYARQACGMWTDTWQRAVTRLPGPGHVNISMKIWG